MEINARNVSMALAYGLDMLFHVGVEEQSRNGAVLVCPEPCIITYHEPAERVIFSPVRDANPFFHLMESLWMLAGRNDLAWPVQFNNRFKEYSDDGKSLAGAYGFRWRRYFGRDQLYEAAKALIVDHSTRRVVVTMWSQNDLGMYGRDLPCNTQIYFDCRGGVLNMTVTNRSNDALWGAFGANAVHFSILQEYMAFWVGIPMGVYRQFTNNLHIYTDILSAMKAETMVKDLCVTDYYDPGSNAKGRCLKPYPLIHTDTKTWDKDLHKFLSKPDLSSTNAYEDDFFNHVAAPMYLAWAERKDSIDRAICYAEQIRAEDWSTACIEWLERRIN